MNTQVTETQVVVYDIMVPADRFALISKYVKENATVDVDYLYDAGRPSGAKILKNGEAVLTLMAPGYVPLQIAETFKEEVLKAIANGLDSVRPKSETPKTKVNKPAATGGIRGKLSQVQKDEIANMALLGMTKEQIAEKVGRSADTVAKYMPVDNTPPVGLEAEASEEDDEEFDVEEEEIEILS